MLKVVDVIYGLVFVHRVARNTDLFKGFYFGSATGYGPPRKWNILFLEQIEKLVNVWPFVLLAWHGLILQMLWIETHKCFHFLLII